MLEQAQIDSFAADMAKLKQDWAKLTPEQRRAAMQAAVDKAAKSAGFPAPKVKLQKLPAGRNGELHFSTWDVAINKSLAANNAISDAEFAKLSDTLYHETRHAEQWYLIAQRDAAEGKTAKQIMKDRGIGNPAVAKSAVKQPLAKGAARRACADALYESVYGTGRDDRNKTLKGLSTNRKAVDAARKKNDASEAAYKKAAADPKSTPEKKAAALAKWQRDYDAYKAASDKSDANYAAYRALPEEADAWEAGEAANQAVQKQLAPPAAPAP